MMTRMIIAMIVLIIFNFYLAIKLNKSDKRLNDMAGYAFETGCYAEAMKACAINKDESTKGNCYEAALKECPDMAKGFKNWVAGGGPK